MIEAARNHKVGEIHLGSFLSVSGVDIGCQISSKKKLMEKITTLLLQGRPELDRKTVLQTLTERERLGSTGIGNGVALPHGRINGLDDVIGAVAVLASPLDYDSLDKQPVNLAFGLLVPAEANEQHLKILAYLARLFSDIDLRRDLVNAKSSNEVYELLTDWAC